MKSHYKHLQEADIFVTPSAYSSARYKWVDYSVTVRPDSHCAMYRYPTFQPDSFGFLKPLELHVNIKFCLQKNK